MDRHDQISDLMMFLARKLIVLVGEKEKQSRTSPGFLAQCDAV